MAFINKKTMEIQVKIVYYGPGRSGKTTNLECLFKKHEKKIETNLVSIKTHDDRTLFFDYMPMSVGTINGFKVKIQLYTVPGQVKYNATRKLVLRGVDGVVFVADSLKTMRKKNVQSLNNLAENLKGVQKNAFDVPLVLQYNKRDNEIGSDNILDVETLEKDLNEKLKVPVFPASALTGKNVEKTFKKIIKLVFHNIKEEFGI